MQAVMRTFNAIEIAQYGIARLMLIVDQRVMPGTQSITMRISESAGGFKIIKKAYSKETDNSPTEARNIILGKITQYQPMLEKNIQKRYN